MRREKARRSYTRDAARLHYPSTASSGWMAASSCEVRPSGRPCGDNPHLGDYNARFVAVPRVARL